MIAALLVCLWPLSLLVVVPKWDNVNAYLPYRYFISDYLWNGHFPFWNSFQNMGYPAYADPQSGMWSPITWLLMLFGKYTMKSLIIELLSYFVLAALGMYHFINTTFRHEKTAAVIGLCYGLSGLMVGTSQMMVFLAGVAWLPWCLTALYRFSKSFHLKHALFSGVLIALHTSTASPAYTIVLAYFYFFAFVYLFWRHKASKQALISLIKGGSIMLFSSVLLLLPYIYSFVEFAPYFSRLTKLPYNDYLLADPFTIINYISFLFPYGVISNSEMFQHTDLSLRNGYIGLVGLLFFVYGCLRFYKNKKVLYLLVAVVFFLIVAMGNQTIIYQWLYHLPGFGVFRHPSFFRTYSLFAMLVIAAFGLKSFFVHYQKDTLLKKITIGFVAIIVLGGGVALTKTSANEISTNISNLVDLTEFSTNFLATHVVINVAVLLLIGVVVFLIKKSLKLSVFTTLFMLAFLDLGMQTQLTFPSTISYPYPYASFKTYFDELPNEISQKDNHKPLKYFDEHQGLSYTQGIWKNMSTFNKTISYVGYNPFQMNNFEKAIASKALAINIENPILFFGEKVKQPNDTIRQGLIWGEADFSNLQKDKTSIERITVGYNSFLATVENKANSSQWLLLNQNYHHLWEAYYQGEKLKIFPLNEHIMGVEIPAQSSGEVRFSYYSKVVYFAWISVMAYILLVLATFYFFVKRKKKAIIK